VSEIKPRPNIVDGVKKITPMWKTDTGQRTTVNAGLKKSPYRIFVATPVHDQCSIHYAQGLLEFQKLCFEKNVLVTFQIMKSSLVTQGRNLCVSGFLESNCTHMLFVDSDIMFNADSIFKMIERDKDIISIPYPLKTMNWKKVWDRWNEGKIKKPEDIGKWANLYPMKIADPHDNVTIERGVIEVTHSPTGCMLIKREVFDKLIQHYPNKKIVQNTVINGEYVNKPHMWNFFDCLHDPVEKTYLGEDFAFCKLWRDIGGKCYSFIDDPIAHYGEYEYQGRFADELIIPK
jgi:hypothetical protein